mmetsp:Transcript_8082/g.23940  ORF Transcript_8082/g.23940 Transcript_8082/m.23940 type:complete len:246 (+) Transcript_8082:57-794(+)
MLALLAAFAVAGSAEAVDSPPCPDNCSRAHANGQNSTRKLKKLVRKVTAFYHSGRPGLGSEPTANETWQNKLDLYVPLPALRPGGAAPLAVFIHGGAFQHGGRVWLPTWLWAWRKRGYAIASVDYRFEAFPAPVDDVRAAVRWLAGNTVRYGIDPRRISVIGSSSGGYLAAMLLTAPERRHLRSVLLLKAPCALATMRADAAAKGCGPRGVALHDTNTSAESILLGCLHKTSPSLASPVLSHQRG